ncbi:MAG: hypothetical protein WCG03_10035 [Kiritimatiellales bacterium]
MKIDTTGLKSFIPENEIFQWLEKTKKPTTERIREVIQKSLNKNRLDPEEMAVLINAEDAAWMFPQGHGDAYGHYLTALKGYYSLLMNDHFDWVPRIEAVNVLGKPVSVDYQDERKFAKAATAWVRAAQQVFELTWRKDFASVKQSGWGHLSESRENPSRT